MPTHLRTHSEYSLLSGMVRIAEAAKQAKEWGMPSLALTDYGNIFGGVELFLECKKQGIHPVLGAVLVVPSYDDHTLKQFNRNTDALYELTVLVKNQAGYKNLSRLLTQSYMEGFYYKPRVDSRLLKDHAEGLIVLSGGFGGEVNCQLMAHRLEAAESALTKWAGIFKDGFYLELHDNAIENQVEINAELARLAKKTGVPLVATANAHYMRRSDAEAFDVLRGIQLSRQASTPYDHLKFATDAYHFKSPDEFQNLFGDYPEAIKLTDEIAQACSFEFDFKTYHFPRYEIPAGSTLESELATQARLGLEGLWEHIKVVGNISDDERSKYNDRLEREIGVIQKMGFSGYFLIVSDFIRWAKAHDIPVGPGRGSGAGSLVAYALRITDLDPLPYNLLFERFLNPERISMPDFDIDFCQDRRGEVIEYVGKKYGHVSQIITFGKMKAKAVVRDVGRVMDMPYEFVDKIAKLVPNALNITLTEAIEQEPKLKAMMEDDPQVERLLKISLRLEGLSRHASTHAAGVIITDRPLPELVPLYRGSNGDVVTMFDMKYVEKIGLIKFDFLGLKTLTVIRKAVEQVKTARAVDVDINSISLRDEKVYDLLSSGDGLGVFQLESSGMRDLLVRMGPSTFEDLIALIALYRPGPLGSGMVDDFIERKKGKKKIEYDLEILEPILKDTYGVIVYQEQVMQIASAVAQYSLGEADLLRRAMGKKKAEEMAAQCKRFLEGAVKTNTDPAKAEKLFELMAKFAEYGFNKSHSAAYALVSYQTAWLKCYYTEEYMAALLSTEMQDTDKILFFINDCKAHGITILGPDINESTHEFRVVAPKTIRYGIGALKGVGEAAIESMLEARKKGGEFKSLYDFCRRVDLRRVTKKVLEVLIKAGAFDYTEMNRHSLFESIVECVDVAAKLQKDLNSGQNDLFADDAPVRKTNKSVEKQLEEWTQNDLLKNEKEAIGFYFSSHPLKAFEETLGKLVTHSVQDLAQLPRETNVTLGGMLVASRVITTKKGDRMAFATLEDLCGTVEVIFFPKAYKKLSEMMSGDDPVILKGTVDQTEDGAKIQATDLSRLGETLRQTTRSVHIEVPFDQMTKDNMRHMLEILKKYSGQSRVYLHVVRDGDFETVVELQELGATACEPLQYHLNNLFSDKAVKFVA